MLHKLHLVCYGNIIYNHHKPNEYFYTQVCEQIIQRYCFLIYFEQLPYHYLICDLLYSLYFKYCL